MLTQAPAAETAHRRIAAGGTLAFEVTAPVPAAELVRSVVLPLRAALRQPPGALLRLDEPAAPGAPLVIHLYAEPGAHECVVACVYEAAAAAGANAAAGEAREPVPGEPPLNADRELTALYAACLVRATEHYLAALEAAAGAPLSYSARQGVVLELVRAGLDAALPAGLHPARYFA